MAQLLLPHAQERPQEPALTDEWGITTWSELNSRVNRLAGALRGLGLQTGDTIALHSRNRREYLELMAAAGHIGLIYVLVNWHWTADELRYVLQDSGARALFSEQSLALDVECEHRVSIGGDIPGYLPYEEFLAGGADEEPDDQTMGWPGFYTSGTTGRPKSVRRKDLGAGSPLVIAEMLGDYFADVLRLPAHGRSLLVGPAYHSAQWMWSFCFLPTGRSIVMRQAFDAAETLRLIDQYAITNVHLVPTQFVRMLKLDPEVRAAFDGSSLQAVWHGAAPCSPEIKRQMIDWWGPIIHEYYGSTESAVNTVAYADEWLKHPGTVGRALPVSEVHVLRSDGSPADVGENGQLYFRYTSGDDVSYHGDPEKTAAMHRGDGLFTTGDIGHQDAEGYLYLADRAIDMIISGGVNIYPAEIEGVLVNHPAVRDIAVFGIPDEEFGEQVKAVVEVQPGIEPGEELVAELIALARGSLAGYKVPRSISFGDLPRTPTGKLMKRLLREPYWEGRDSKI
jgi:long-chain acyl-CoA synthetase